MTQTEELGNADGLPSSAGQISDEELEAVTGGLTRPLEPDGHEHPGKGGRSDAGHDDAADA